MRVICLLLAMLSATALFGIVNNRASFYADKFEGRRTASGQIFHQNKFTAAHLTLPFGTRLKVTNLKNYKSVIVTVNDRGPYSDFQLDLSKAAAKAIGITVGMGWGYVKWEIVK